MPIRHAHEDQATRNHSFWTGIDIQTTPHLDWVVTGMFYEAVHWIESYLATQSCHSRNHGDRSSNIALHPALHNDPSLAVDYGTLRTESENARYWCYRHTPQQVTADLVPVISRVRNSIQVALP